MIVATDARTPSDRMPMVMFFSFLGICTWRSRNIGTSEVLISVKILAAETKYDTFKITA
jgi:hypothetical protein